MANNNIYKLGATVEASSDEEGFKGSYYVATIIENPKGDKCLVEPDIVDGYSKNVIEVVHVSKLRPLPPVVKMDEIIQVDDCVDAYHNNRWWKGHVVQVVDETNYDIYFDTPPHNLLMDPKKLRIHLDWVDGEWVKPPKKTNELGALDNMTSKCHGRQKKPRVGNYCGTSAKNNNIAACIGQGNESVIEELGVLSEARGNRNEQTRDRIIENVEGSNGSRRTSVRKRGRPRKFVLEEELDGHAEEITNSHQVEDQANKLVNKMAKEWLSEGCKDTSKTVEIVTQNQGVTSDITLAEKQADETDTSKTDDHIMDVELMIDDSLPELGDDKPQLTDKSSTAIDQEADGKKSSAVGTEDIVQISPPQKGIEDIASGGLVTTPAIIHCNSMDNNGDVPFVKHSPLWKHVESIDIYSKTKRKPHFSPLLEFSEVSREGLAIAHIVTFAAIVEKTCKLQFSDSRSVIQKNLQAIADLEKHGFDVEPVQRRLTVLLTMKEKEETLEAECNEIKSEITNNALENGELVQEINKVNQRMKELAEELKEIETRKVMKDELISTLHSKEEAIRENVHNLEQEFKSIAGCPFKW